MNDEHEFYKSLALSHAASNLPIWEEMYRAAFPDFQARIDHRDDGEHQRAGIDVSVIRGSSKQILIDEKIRGKNKKTGRVYADIALEYISNDVRQSPGWVCKPLRADYIAYAIAPLGIGYLLPVVQLQMAWNRYSDRWFKSAENDKSPFRKIVAPNRGYNTLSLCVPPVVLMTAIRDCLTVYFSKTQWCV